MAQILKASTARLTWGVEDPKVVLEDDGDILTPLRRVYNQYVAKACELYEKSMGHEKSKAVRAAADAYKHQAENILQLINQ